MLEVSKKAIQCTAASDGGYGAFGFNSVFG